jgi:hypothetical protein
MRREEDIVDGHHYNGRSIARRVCSRQGPTVAHMGVRMPTQATDLADLGNTRASPKDD